MGNIFHQDFRDFLQALNNHQVRVNLGGTYASKRQLNRFPIMRMMIFFLPFSCLSCTVSKKYNQYIGKTRDYLVIVEGTPSEIKKDTADGEQIVYRKEVKLHNPKYLFVTEIVTFYIDRKSEVYKWSERKYKQTRPTPKPQLAIE